MVEQVASGRGDAVAEEVGEERVQRLSWVAEPVDVGELLFGKSLDRFFLDLSSPKLIVALKPRDPRYSYVQFLVRMLRDAHRVFHGSLPMARYVQFANDVHARLPWLPVQGSVTVIDLSWGLTRSVRMELCSRIEERLREFVSQGPGFLVLYIEEPALHDIEKVVERVFNDVTCPDVLEVSIDESKPLNHYLRVVASYLGFVSFEEFGSVKSVDSLTMYLDAAARRVLAEIATRDPSVVHRLSVCAENEEVQRFWLRALVLKSLGSESASIHVCYRFARGLEIDVYVRDRDEAYLVETLTNARVVESRLRFAVSTVLGAFSKLNLVIPNGVLLLFSKRIVSTLRDLCSWGGNVEIYGVDVARQRLVPMRELLELVQGEGLENAGVVEETGVAS